MGVVTKTENLSRMLTGRRVDRVGTVEEDVGGWRWRWSGVVVAQQT